MTGELAGSALVEVRDPYYCPGVELVVATVLLETPFPPGLLPRVESPC